MPCYLTVAMAGQKSREESRLQRPSAGRSYWVSSSEPNPSRSLPSISGVAHSTTPAGKRLHVTMRGEVGYIRPCTRRSAPKHSRPRARRSDKPSAIHTSSPSHSGYSTKGRAPFSPANLSPSICPEVHTKSEREAGQGVRRSKK